MEIKNLIFITFLLIVIIIIDKNSKEDFINTNFLGPYPKFGDIKGLSFSNTTKWNDNFYQQIIEPLTENQYKMLKILSKYYKEFPINDSDETKKEIEDLLKLQKERTKKDEKDIKFEIKANDMLTLFNIDKEEQDNLIEIFKEITPVVMSIKRTYDRVRPSLLDNRIKPSIEVPGHPAYPSGHSIQCYIAYNYLKKKYPEREDEFLKIADKIAKNREIAGVHYKSDTKYGKLLAEKIFELI